MCLRMAPVTAVLFWRQDQRDAAGQHVRTLATNFLESSGIGFTGVCVGSHIFYSHFQPGIFLCSYIVCLGEHLKNTFLPLGCLEKHFLSYKSSPVWLLQDCSGNQTKILLIVVTWAWGRLFLLCLSPVEEIYQCAPLCCSGNLRSAVTSHFAILPKELQGVLQFVCCTSVPTTVWWLRSNLSLMYSHILMYHVLFYWKTETR